MERRGEDDDDEHPIVPHELVNRAIEIPEIRNEIAAMMPWRQLLSIHRSTHSIAWLDDGIWRSIFRRDFKEHAQGIIDSLQQLVPGQETIEFNWFHVYMVTRFLFRGIAVMASSLYFHGQIELRFNGTRSVGISKRVAVTAEDALSIGGKHWDFFRIERRSSIPLAERQTLTVEFGQDLYRVFVLDEVKGSRIARADGRGTVRLKSDVGLELDVTYSDIPGAFRVDTVHVVSLDCVLVISRLLRMDAPNLLAVWRTIVPANTTRLYIGLSFDEILEQVASNPYWVTRMEKAVESPIFWRDVADCIDTSRVNAAYIRWVGEVGSINDYLRPLFWFLPIGDTSSSSTTASGRRGEVYPRHPKNTDLRQTLTRALIRNGDSISLGVFFRWIHVDAEMTHVFRRYTVDLLDTTGETHMPELTPVNRQVFPAGRIPGMIEVKDASWFISEDRGHPEAHIVSRKNSVFDARFYS